MRAPKFALAATTTVLVIAGLSGCSGDSDDSGTSTSPAATTAEDGTTVPGTDLELGKHAVVSFTAGQKHESLIELTVTSVKKGKLKDLDRFELNAEARKSTVYYVSTKVKNLGPDELSGSKITLYGKVSDELVIPPVVFGSSFPTCDYVPLPKGFSKGKTVKGCMVMLVPKHGAISEVQWRAPDNSEPISWSLP
jgi:hypothetical protein